MNAEVFQRVMARLVSAEEKVRSAVIDLQAHEEFSWAIPFLETAEGLTVLQRDFIRARFEGRKEGA